MLVSLAVGWLARRFRGPSQGDESRTRTLLLLWVLALSFFATDTFLISLVSFPFWRYFLSTMIFLPCALTATLFEIWRRLLVAARLCWSA